eukprot:m.799836 g.799836  ORF g.799836 m.799836 type:complete len:55 (+) comp23354_c2_seq6:3290-3454(+)
MQASDVESIFNTVSAHAAILDSRQTTTTSAALFHSGGHSTAKLWSLSDTARSQL